MQTVSLLLNVEQTTEVVGRVLSSNKQKASILELFDHPFFFNNGTKEALDFSGSNVQSFIFKDAMPDAWGGALVKYRLKQKGINKPSLSDIVMMIGESGAWRFQPATPNEHNATSIIDWRETIYQTHNIIKGIPVGDALSWLVGSDSLGGARPKFYVDFDEHEQPTYQMPPNQRQWIVKLPSPIDRNDIGILEYRYNQLARACGILVPDFKLVDGRYFATKRFDLTPNGNLYARTLAGINGLSHADAMGNSYESVIRNSMRLFGQNNAEEVLSLALFNRIVGNCDDHAKNISFLCDQSHQWSLAPAYDLTPNAGLGSQAMSLCNTLNPDLSDFLTAANEFNVDPLFIHNIIKRLQEPDGLPDEEIELIKTNISTL